MIWPALIGAAATIGSGVLGAQSADQAAEYNYWVDILNYNQRERERMDSINQAKHQEADSKLGSTDAAGNRVHFVEGRGWVTDLSPEQALLQQLYQQEETQQLQNDLPAKRQILNANVARQGKENLTADALYNAFMRVERGSDTEYENQLNQASNAGITGGFDSALNDAMSTALRTGASNSGKVAADIGQKRADALRNAFMENKINSRGKAGEEYDTSRGNLANLYNMFASRASSMPDVGYNPRNIEGMTAQQQEGAAGRNQNAVGALINAFAKQGGSMQRIDPNYGWANALMQGGAAVAGIGDNDAATRRRNQAFQDYGGYADTSEMYRGSTGSWG